MKKWILCIWTVLCLVLAAGCGKSSAGPESGTSLQKFYDSILAQQPEGVEELIFFEESDPGLIESLYPGITEIDLAQQAFYMPPIITAPCEIVLVEVMDSADVEQVVDIFQARIDDGADDTAYPDSAAGWQKNGQVQQSGNFVCMIVLPDGYVIPENVFDIN